MLGLTLAEAQLQLSQVNDAIAKIIQGTAVNELRVGSGSFTRLYRFQDITIDSLRELRAELMSYISAIAPETPIFRTNATIPLIVHKNV